MNKEFIDEEMLELPESTVEQLIVKQLLDPLDSVNSLFIRQHFKSNWFTNENLKTIYSFLNNYWAKYSAAPSQDLVYKILENDKFKETKHRLLPMVNSIYEIDETKYDKKFLQDTFINFIKGKAI